jgi:putative thioredoxin
MADVTDATFETAVIERSKTVPVVVDLWAEWCGPCKTLGPILEKVIAETEGGVELAKVDVDANPQVSGAFQVQSIPAVFALAGGRVVDSFIGAQPEAAVRAFVDKLRPQPSEADLLADRGDEPSYRAALALDPAHKASVVGLAQILVDKGEKDDALALLARIPEDSDVRRVQALARVGAADDPAEELDGLLEKVKEDDDARQRFVDLLELMGPDDPRTAQYRRKLTTRLF